MKKALAIIVDTTAEPITTAQIQVLGFRNDLVNSAEMVPNLGLLFALNFLDLLVGHSDASISL
jgi:hypothetical protein